VIEGEDLVYTVTFMLLIVLKNGEKNLTCYFPLFKTILHNYIIHQYQAISCKQKNLIPDLIPETRLNLKIFILFL